MFNNKQKFKMFPSLKLPVAFKINPYTLSVEEDDEYEFEDETEDDADLEIIFEKEDAIVSEDLSTTDNLFSLGKNKWKRSRDWILDLMYENPNLLNIIKSGMSGVIDFFFGKDSPPSILTATFASIFDTIKSSYFQSYSSLVSSKKGFTYLHHKSTNIGFLFIDVLEKYSHKTIKFLDGTSLIHYEIPLGDVYVYSYMSTNKEYYLYFNTKNIKKSKLLEFLSAEKIKLIDSKFILFSKKEEENSYSISGIKPLPKPSQIADEKLNHINKFISKGINRSMLFYGAPGTGKTSLAVTLLEKLGYRTLVFNASYKVGAANIIDYMIDVFNIEAIIIDDFDQLPHSNEKLELLETLNKRLKVVIGVANSLKEFHPALLRPGRFDEVILINELDKDCILSVLGQRGEQLYEFVKHWPIAYIQELSKRLQFLSDEEIQSHIEELEKRVSKQLGKLL